MRTSALPAAIQLRTQGCAGKIVTKIKDVITSETLPPAVPLVHPQLTNLSDFVYIADENVIQVIRNLPCKTSPMDYVSTTHGSEKFL